MSDDRDHKPTRQNEEGFDPRPVSDAELRENVSREEVEGYKETADKAHSNWFSVMNNPYGKD